MGLSPAPGRGRRGSRRLPRGARHQRIPRRHLARDRPAEPPRRRSGVAPHPFPQPRALRGRAHAPGLIPAEGTTLPFRASTSVGFDPAERGVPVNTIGSAARRRAMLAFICSSVLVVSLSISTPAPAAATCLSPPAVLPAAQIAPGMVGTGLTTVQGSTPTSFDIEVIGTLEDAILPGHDLVMFQITGPQSFLDEAHGMFFGMSGSPITINGMLAGAASYRFYFSDADIGLFTPAEEMLNIVDGPAMPVSVPLTAQARRLVAEAAGVPTSAAPGSAQILRTPLAVSGMATAQMDRLQATLDEQGLPMDVVPAAAPSAGLDKTPLAPGSPMGAAISIGDISFVGIGTTTFTCGSNVNVGWGHPFFFEGPSRMALTD